MRAVELWGYEAEHVCPNVGRDVTGSWNSTASWPLDLEFLWPSGGKGHMTSLPSGPIGSPLAEKVLKGICHCECFLVLPSELHYCFFT